jgi:hypothetical protein
MKTGDYFSTVMIPSAGRPSGRRAFHRNRDMGVSTPIIYSLIDLFSWEILFTSDSVLLIDRLEGAPSLPQRGKLPKGNIPLTPFFRGFQQSQKKVNLNKRSDLFYQADFGIGYLVDDILIFLF